MKFTDRLDEITPKEGMYILHVYKVFGAYKFRTDKITRITPTGIVKVCAGKIKPNEWYVLNEENRNLMDNIENIQAIRYWIQYDFKLREDLTLEQLEKLKAEMLKATM